MSISIDVEAARDVFLQLKHFETVQKAYLDFVKYLGDIFGTEGDKKSAGEPLSRGRQRDGRRVEPNSTAGSHMQAASVLRKRPRGRAEAWKIRQRLPPVIPTRQPGCGLGSRDGLRSHVGPSRCHVRGPDNCNCHGRCSDA